MFSKPQASLLLGWMIALLLAQQADAATYNFYFPKKGGPPKVERVEPSIDDEEDAVVVNDDEDDEPAYEEEVIPPPPAKRAVRTYIVIPPVILRSTPVPVKRSGAPTPAPVIELEDDGAEVDAATYVVPPGTDLLSGTNTTPGHRLRPRTKVVRRTFVIDR